MSVYSLRVAFAVSADRQLTLYLKSFSGISAQPKNHSPQAFFFNIRCALTYSTTVSSSFFLHLLRHRHDLFCFSNAHFNKPRRIGLRTQKESTRPNGRETERERERTRKIPKQIHLELLSMIRWCAWHVHYSLHWFTTDMAIAHSVTSHRFSPTSKTPISFSMHSHSGEYERWCNGLNRSYSAIGGRRNPCLASAPYGSAVF